MKIAPMGTVIAVAGIAMLAQEAPKAEANCGPPFYECFTNSSAQPDGGEKAPDLPAPTLGGLITGQPAPPAGPIPVSPLPSPIGCESCPGGEPVPATKDDAGRDGHR